MLRFLQQPASENGYLPGGALQHQPVPSRMSFPTPCASTDGRLVFEQFPGDIGVLTVEGDRTMELVLDEDFPEGRPAVSPDGRWIAYQSGESGQGEIYVRPFSQCRRWQVAGVHG